ncbi:trehalose-phosphatase [Limobrevibacterium gyesilva]|uniref:Trehalose 6-phosphate phosphatase n=1 Tax=Limobrevibacterium gyesilva TaxID=2991712 RepID=A0AA41YS08_9PROT|nr:trehalose-phosphatase [Limobrevibacterium gyesilva]MCW3474432.1 trehalose-phosphatase [Limobrevibacterium gyesilva]
MPALTKPPLPPQAALLLDLDGTLLDIAPTPDSVVVPPGLLLTLRRLRTRFADALAVVTGRPIEQIDALLGDIPYAVAGEHGGVIRHAPDAPLERAPLADLPAHWLAQAEHVVAGIPGALLERKARSFVLHYRLAPDAGPALRAAMLDMLDGHEDRFSVMDGSMALEMKPLGADKATAVTALMSRPPFSGRMPVYVGDDVTDEDGIRAARALGGFGWRVKDCFTDPAGVRAWLAREAGG